jgi:hypothetical protein
MNEDRLGSQESHEKRVDRLWEWVLHEDNLFISRGNFFLLAEAMLFAAFATVAVAPSVKPVLVFILGLVGVVCSGVWIYLSWVQVNFTMKPLTSRLKELIPDHYEVVSGRRKYPPLDFILGILFPLFLLIMWLTLLLIVLIPAI